MLHIARDVLYHDAYTGKVVIGELLIRCQGVISSGLMGCDDIPPRAVVLQAVKVSITDDGPVLWNLVNHLRLDYVSQVMPRPRRGIGYIASPNLLVDHSAVIASDAIHLA